MAATQAAVVVPSATVEALVPSVVVAPAAPSAAAVPQAARPVAVAQWVEAPLVAAVQAVVADIAAEASADLADRF